MSRKPNQNRKSIAEALQSISTANKPVPKSGFILLILLYIIATVVLIRVTRFGGELAVGRITVNLRETAGIFSSLANLCIILLVVIYRKAGFITGLAILLTQFPTLFVDVIRRHNFSAVSGFFFNVMSIAVLIIIFVNYTRVERYRKKIMEQAITDFLTGLPNRYAGREYCNSLVKRGEPFVYVTADISNFRSINDTMGYETGNKVLIEIANRWRDLADSRQTGTYNLVAHVGGDEYGFTIQDFESEEQILNTISLFREELERKITIEDCDYYVSACFGYAVFPEDAANLESLLSCSSTALHEAKRRVLTKEPVRFDKAILQSERNLEIERRIREALDEDTFFFNLQPQFDINHRLRGFEALARLKDPDGKYISPAEFIPVAERNGLVDRIDLSVLKQAAKFMEEASVRGSTDFMISVNVSVRHLLKNNFPDEVRNIMESYKIDPKRLEIEITESVMIDSVELALNHIQKIRELGVLVAIDDFGTGYSSLSYLKCFPANLLKIDKSFIDVLEDGESNVKYVASIISIGHIMGLEVISEGVEREEQLQILKEIGCDYIQGFFWGRPLPPEEAAKLTV